jgi:hypothetical protein
MSLSKIKFGYSHASNILAHTYMNLEVVVIFITPLPVKNK